MRPTRKRAIGVLALTALIALPLAVTSARPGATAATYPIAPGPAPVEGQQFSGNWTQVNDPSATNGTAVMINSGAASVTTSTVANSYMLNFRLRSGAARVSLTLNGQQVGTAVLYGGAWRTVSVPVRVNGTPTWAVQALPGIGYQPQPVYLDWMSLQLATPGYTAAGNKIIDPAGQPFTPRGVNRDGFQFQPKSGYYMSDNDYQAMYLWGSTIVRLPLGQQYWLTSSCAYDPTFMSRLDSAVQSITERGMVALLDLHSTFAGKLCDTGPRAAPLPDTYSIQFWTEVANRYKSNPLVAFELFNEPHDITDVQWHDGGTVGAGYQGIGMQQMYDTVRATGATNLIFVDGYSWAYRIDVALTRPIDGYGIVYAPHLYNPPETGPLKSNIDTIVTPVAAVDPVVVTEFGSSSGSALYMQNVIDYAESHGIGWVAYTWYQLPQTYALLTDFYSYMPSTTGAPVRAALLKAKGWTTPGG